MSEERWPLDKVIEETRKGLIELAPPGEAKSLEEIDTSYITQELIDSYWDDAKDKDEECVRKESEAKANVACYWGNNWAHISANKWAYTNSHSGTGCDPVSNSVLCGSGHRWRVNVNTMTGRYCSNGAKNAYMAWP